MTGEEGWKAFTAEDAKSADQLPLIFASALPDFCPSALFYTQSFERNMDNGRQ